MPGFNPDKINIHDLTIEEPEKQTEVPFDPERDIMAEDWERIYKKIKSDIWVYTSIKILDPQFVDKKIIQKQEDSANKTLERKEWGSFLTYARHLKIIKPGAKININDEMRRGVEAILKDQKIAKNWWDFAWTAMSIKLIDPKFKVDPEDWEKLENYLSTRSNQADYVRQAMKMRIINQDWNPNWSTNTWNEIKKELESRRVRNDAGEFAEMAAAMKIMAAEEVKSTEKGLEINMKKKSIETEVSQMPEQRNF